jgi:hypothetical protein
MSKFLDKYYLSNGDSIFVSKVVKRGFFRFVVLDNNGYTVLIRRSSIIAIRFDVSLR